MQEIIVKNNSRLVLFVVDGLGDLPYNGKTPLEAAQKNNIQKLISKSALGMAYPIGYGITVGSGPGHMALFGLDPLKYQIKRGILEVLGMDMEIKPNSIAIRGNWATVQKVQDKFIVIDRRASRIATEQNQRLVELIHPLIERIGQEYQVEIQIKSGMEHRLGVVITPKNGKIDVDVSTNDPQKEGLPVINFSERSRIGAILETLNKRIFEMFENQKANYILFRGITDVPSLPNFGELYKVKPLAIAQYPMYLGIAKLLGFQTIRIENYDNITQFFEDFDFVYVHYKYTDMAGEDGDFQRKVKEIENADRVVGKIIEIDPDVLVVTGDHSTPCMYKSHGFQPTPYLVYSKAGDVFGISKDFNEKECLRGELGIFPMLWNMQIMLAYGKRLQKFGA